jgi:hypothetical protein
VINAAALTVTQRAAGTEPTNLVPSYHLNRNQKQGDGQGGLKVDPHALAGWFEGLDAVLPHARVALSELSCLDDGAAAMGGGCCVCCGVLCCVVCCGRSCCMYV